MTEPNEILNAMTMPDNIRSDASSVLAGEYEFDFGCHPRTVLDLGGNVGAFAIWAREKWPEAHVISYEPVQENADWYAQNLSRYDRDGRWTLVRTAVWDRQGTLDLREGRNGCCWSVCDRSWDGMRTVVAPCADAAVLPEADFIKIDIEGSERVVLDRMDLTKVQGLAVEVHDPADVRHIRSRCFAAGLLLNRQRPTVDECQLLTFTRHPAPRKLMVAIPCYGSVPMDFASCLLSLQSKPPCNLDIRFTNGDSLVTRARNTLAADFVESNCSHVLWIDSDIVFSPWHVARLMEHKEDVVGGLYPKKQPGPAAWVLNTLDDKTEPRADGLQQVKYVGSGFMRVTRRVFDQVRLAWEKQIGFRPDGVDRAEWDFWPVGIYRYKDGSRRYLSEDWYFCQRWRDMGGSVWADTRCWVKHIGKFTYPESIE